MSETTEQQSESSAQAEEKAADGKKLPFKERFMAFVQEYGPVAFVTWFGIFFLTWGGFILAIQFGLDVGREAADATADGGALETGGVVGGAYLATQLTKPLRIAATFALTPLLAAAWKRVRGGDSSELPKAEAEAEAEPPDPSVDA